MKLLAENSSFRATVAPGDSIQVVLQEDNGLEGTRLLVEEAIQIEDYKVIDGLKVLEGEDFEGFKRAHVVAFGELK